MRDSNLTATCHCGGAFVGTVGRAELGRKLALVVSIARYHKLSHLEEFA